MNEQLWVRFGERHTCSGGSCCCDHPLTSPAFRKPTPAEVLAYVATLPEAEVVDTGWHPLKTFGDGPGVYIAPGRYLVVPWHEKEDEE